MMRGRSIWIGFILIAAVLCSEATPPGCLVPFGDFLSEPTSHVPDSRWLTIVNVALLTALVGPVCISRAYVRTGGQSHPAVSPAFAGLGCAGIWEKWGKCLVWKGLSL